MIKLNNFKHICEKIQRNKTRRDTRLNFYKTMAILVVLYGCQTQVLSKSEHSSVREAEMRFQREARGFSLEEKIRSEDIKWEPDIFSLEKRQRNSDISNATTWKNVRKFFASSSLHLNCLDLPNPWSGEEVNYVLLIYLKSLKLVLPITIIPLNTMRNIKLSNWSLGSNSKVKVQHKDFKILI